MKKRTEFIQFTALAARRAFPSFRFVWQSGPSSVTELSSEAFNDDYVPDSKTSSFSSNLSSIFLSFVRPMGSARFSASAGCLCTFSTLVSINKSD